MSGKKVVSIEDWKIALDDEGKEHIVGVVINHPDFKKGTIIYSSEIIRYLPAGLLIETENTYYDLGNPKEVLI